MTARTGLRIGLDVGGTKTEAVLTDSDGTVHRRLRTPTRWGPEGVVATALGAIEDVCGGAEIEPSDVASIGIGVPGRVDAGVVRHALNLGVEELDLAAAVSSRTRRPVRVENDVKAAALGAARLLGCAGSFVYLNLGTGVAAGHVVDGRLRRGARGSAGEIGHVSIDPRGPLCRCGQRGCVESLAGGAAIAERWGVHGSLPVLDVFDAADRGDPRARAIRADLARGVAAAVTLLVLSLDPDRIAIGGGITALGVRLSDVVGRALDVAAEASGFVRTLDVAARAELLPRDLPAAAFGAAMLEPTD